MVESGVHAAIDISHEAKAEVRHRCGYGCVRCGVTVYLYADLPVEGDKEALAPSTILLCPSCYDLLRKNSLTDEQYTALYTRPVMRDWNFDRRNLPYMAILPEIRAAGTGWVRDVSILVMVGDVTPLVFSPPSRGLGAMRLTLNLCDSTGEMVRVIDMNRWAVSDDSEWKFYRRGSHYAVESEKCPSRMDLDFPEPGKVIVTHLLTQCHNHQLEITPDWVSVDGHKSSDVIRSGQLVGCRL